VSTIERLNTEHDRLRAEIQDSSEKLRGGGDHRLLKKFLNTPGEAHKAVEIQWPEMRIDAFQEDIINRVFDESYGEVAIKGCTGAGKGASVALAINLWFWHYPLSKVLITSTSAFHAQSVMFAEVLTWRKAMRYPGVGKNLLFSVEHSGRHYIRILNPDSGEGFSGHHGPRTMFVFDEASSAQEEFYNLALTQANKIVALSNPRVMSGLFHSLFPRDNPNITQTIRGRMRQRRCVTISGLDCLNVQTRKKLIPGQIDAERFDIIMGNPDPLYRRIYGLAEFPDADPEKQLIQMGWLKRHHDEWTSSNNAQALVTAFGLDVAASEYGDTTVLAAGSAWGCTQLHTRVRGDDGENPSDTMQTVAWVIMTARMRHGIDLRTGSVPVCVDADGVGKGVADRLREIGVQVIFFRGNETAHDPKRWANRRTAAYAELARRLDPLGAYSTTPWALPPDMLLAEELCAPEKVYGSDAMKFRITPKTRQPGMSEKVLTIHDKIKRSPDRADAVVYLYEVVRMRYAKIPPRVNRPLVYDGMEIDPPGENKPFGHSMHDLAIAKPTASPLEDLFDPYD
jgi:hypothetical protein